MITPVRQRDAVSILIDQATRAHRMVAGLRSFEIVGDPEAEAYWRDKLAEWRAEVETVLQPYPAQLKAFRDAEPPDTSAHDGWFDEVTAAFESRMARLPDILEEIAARS